MIPDEILIDLLLNFIPKKVKESGKSREYFEKEVLSRQYPNLTEGEKTIIIGMTKRILDKAFPVQKRMISLTYTGQALALT